MHLLLSPVLLISCFCYSLSFLSLCLQPCQSSLLLPSTFTSSPSHFPSTPSLPLLFLPLRLLYLPSLSFFLSLHFPHLVWMFKKGEKNLLMPARLKRSGYVPPSLFTLSCLLSSVSPPPPPLLYPGNLYTFDQNRLSPCHCSVVEQVTSLASMAFPCQHGQHGFPPQLGRWGSLERKVFTCFHWCKRNGCSLFVGKVFLLDVK